MKHNSTWLLSCLTLGMLITSCSDKKSDVDKQEQGVYKRQFLLFFLIQRMKLLLKY